MTLGVADLDRARRFYERLGWAATGPTDEVVFFQARRVGARPLGAGRPGGRLGLTDSGGWGGITLAHNVRSREEVDALLDRRKRGRVDQGGGG